MNVPRLTHLQFLVVGIVRSRELAGREIREQLREYGVRKAGPAFYQLMSRLEDSGLVQGSYHQQIVEGQIIRERHYTITADGLDAWSKTRDFYSKAIADFDGAEGLAGA